MQGAHDGVEAHDHLIDPDSEQQSLNISERQKNFPHVNEEQRGLQHHAVPVSNYFPRHRVHVDNDSLMSSEKEDEFELVSVTSLSREAPLRRILRITYMMVLVILVTVGAAGVAQKLSPFDDGDGGMSPSPTPPSASSPVAAMLPPNDEFVSEVERRLPTISAPLLRVISSPQHQAFQKLLEEDPAFLSRMTDDQLQERFILLTLYYANGGDGWQLLSEFLKKGSNVCDWNKVSNNNLNGVSCDGDDGLISELQLRSFGMKGSLPDEIGLLKSLVYISLADNVLTGTIPSTIGHMTSLETLDLSNNLISGTIPSTLGDIGSQITTIILIENEVTGTIPSHIAKLDKLEHLDLSANHLTGTIPPEFGLLTAMRSIALGENELTGTLPPAFSGLYRLQSLGVDSNYMVDSLDDFLSVLPDTIQNLFLENNDFEGTIPAVTLSRFQELQVLNLFGNRLGGTLPTELAQLSMMRSLELGTNEFIGTIPSQIGQMTELELFSVHHGQLVGTIPLEFANLPKLKTVSFYNNSLTGRIENTLNSMPTGVQQLLLSFNNFTGSIPALDLLSLTSLEMEFNSIEGSIPTEIGQLSSMDTLNLFGNQLTGTIPSEIGFLIALRVLRVGYNKLSGVLPDQLANLSGLRLIDVSENELTGLPGELLLRIPSLRTGILQNNNWTSIVSVCTLKHPTLRLNVNSCQDRDRFECPCCSFCCDTPPYNEQQQEHHEAQRVCEDY